MSCWHADDAAQVEVKLYGESLCPYCIRFTTQNVAPLFKQGLGSIFNFTCARLGLSRPPRLTPHAWRQRCTACLLRRRLLWYILLIKLYWR